MLKNTFENIIKELKDIKKELNIEKCEYLSSIENDELIVNNHKYIEIDKTKYLGQIINNKGIAKEETIITKLGTIGSTLNIAAGNLTKKDRIKIF